MTSPETLPDHLMSLPGDGSWALWRTLCLRGAGFPSSDVLRIADAECSAAADRLNAVEDEAEGLRNAALESLRAELAAATKEQLDPIVKSIRKVKRSQVPAKTEGLAAGTIAAIEAWKAAAGRVEEEKKAYQAVYAASEERTENVLREIAGNDRFREAVIWQNRHAAETGLAYFLRRKPGGGKTSARDRGHLQMLASYLQRYCTKNDTVGFFGPVGWGNFAETDEMISVRPGKELLASREVYMEGWAIDAIADKLAEDEAMRPWLAPRRSPYLRREGNVYIAPDGQRMELGPLSGALMGACDGTRSARSIMRELSPEPEAEAFLWGMLADLHTRGLIRWSFQVPLSNTPERTFRDLLLQIEDEPLRERGLAMLEELVRGRDAVAAAAGDVEALDAALSGLEESFTRATEGKAVTRGDGQLYAGRTLVYEDCRRDIELALGKPFLEELAPPLSLILTAARWFTYHVAGDLREMFSQAYAELRPQTESPRIDLLTFARLALPRLVNWETHLAMQRELHLRWQRVLTIPEGERRVHFRSEDLLPLVEKEFDAPGPGWLRARYHSPDMLISAKSVEAIQQGDYQIVLGEIHAAINSLDRCVFFAQHPDPDVLRGYIDSDLPEPSVILSYPKVWNQEQAVSHLGLWAPALSGRMDLASRSPKDFYLDFCLDPPGFPQSQVLAVSELVIEPGEDGHLLVGPRDGRVRFNALDFFQLVLMMQALSAFQILSPGDHTPRVTIDRTVVMRERWSFPAGSLELTQTTAPERFAAVRRWAKRHDLPRYIFVKSPAEEKPFYCDLESPVLVEILAKAVRNVVAIDPSAGFSFSEMLPDHDHIWLPDAEGNRYTCELRMVVVDQKVDAGTGAVRISA